MGSKTIMSKIDNNLVFVQRLLMGHFLGYIAIALIIALIFELELLEISNLSSFPGVVFWIQTIMELLMICLIPMALRLFRFKNITKQLAEKKVEALQEWGLIRISMIGLPMIVNTYLYEQTQVPAFGYMAIILFLSDFFVTPTMGRCKAETGCFDEEEKEK